MKVPDVYIIGTQKSGTTTIYDWLAQHPQIYAHPLAKDYPYFSNDNIYEKEHKRFLSFASGSSNGELILGGDVNVMFSEAAAARIYREMPNARLIAILRNPIDRAYSAYCYSVEKLLEDRSFEKAIQEELQGYVYTPEDSARMDYLAHGCYADQLKRIYSFFSRDQVKIILFEDLKDNPLEVLKDIFRFLHIDDEFIPNLRVSNVTKGGQRYRWIAKVIYGTQNILIREIIRRITPFAFRTWIRRKLADWNRLEKNKPAFTDAARHLLEDYYKDRNRDLINLIGDQIVRWESPREER